MKNVMNIKIPKQYHIEQITYLLSVFYHFLWFNDKNALPEEKEKPKHKTKTETRNIIIIRKSQKWRIKCN